MRDIIEELCSGCFDTRFHASKEYLRQVKEDEPLWDQVAEVFGPEASASWAPRRSGACSARAFTWERC